MKKLKKEGPKAKLDIVNENCCGIDVGSKSHMVATGLELEDVREFGVYTSDIKKIIDHLQSLGVRSVAMESTGSYWQALFTALQLAGFAVHLVDGKQTKNYKKKTDFQDARAIYQLFRLGFLSSCYLPDQQTYALRSLFRYRNVLLEENTRNTNRMQKVLRLMNFRIDNVLSDVMGKSGQKIINTIISGNTDAEYLTSLVDRRVRKTQEEIKKGCTGQWDAVQIFLLEDSYKSYQNNIGRIALIDKKIKTLLESYVENDPSKKGTKKQLGKNQINIGLQNLSYQYYGVDLFAIESVSYNLVMTLISEVGKGIEKFETSKEFCSWLRLAPNNRISGGKVLSSRTPKGSNPLSIAFRNAANTISKTKTGYLQSFFKRIAYKKGRAAAVTATARKLATIIWNMTVKKEEYQPAEESQVSNQIKNRILKNIANRLKRLDIDPKMLSSRLVR